MGLVVGCGSCAPLDNGVPECAVDFMVLLGKVCVLRLPILFVGVMCPGWFWAVMVCLVCFGLYIVHSFYAFCSFFFLSID